MPFLCEMFVLVFFAYALRTTRNRVHVAKSGRNINAEKVKQMRNSSLPPICEVIYCEVIYCEVIYCEVIYCEVIYCGSQRKSELHVMKYFRQLLFKTILTKCISFSSPLTETNNRIAG